MRQRRRIRLQFQHPMVKRALITGITGQDGSYLAELLLEKGYEVFGMFRRSSAPNLWRIEHVLDRLTLRPADLLDQLSLLRLVDEVRPHEFYNLAAMSFVPASWDQPMLTGEFNSQGVTRILDVIRRVDPGIRFYQASSSEMFGKVRQVPQNELTPFYPRSPYGVSKVFAHYITVNYRESYNLFAVSGMLFNHESPRRGLEFVTRKVTDGVARIKLGLADSLSLGNLDAHRDWGFAGDYVRALWLMLQQERPVEFAAAGFHVTGFDVDASKIAEINAGRSYIPDVPEADLAKVVKSGHLTATTDMRELASMDVADICVPTPLRKTKDPDLSYVVKALEGVAASLKVGQLVILESTTYPGTTDEVALPMLEARGLKVDRDFFLAFSPERVDPGNRTYTTRNIPKIVGGHGPASTEVAVALYAQIVTTVVPVSSTRVAEMVKLLENTFRAVNIGLVNEIAQMCHKMDINVWEVIDAAKTKPFGFMPFYPGPGLGGHCIPIDPFYLSWKARQNGFECRFIELAGQINSSMPDYVVERVSEALNSQRKPINGSRVHVLGVAYKKDVNDMRESPALDVLELLVKRGAQLSYSDPFVPELRHNGHVLTSVDVASALKAPPDCGIICTDHTGFDYDAIVGSGMLLVDTRNALKDRQAPTIFRL